MPQQHRTTRDLMREHPEQHTMKLGNVVFRLNPASYSEDSTRSFVTVQVAGGGFGRYDFGPKPTTYDVQGTTGLAGVNGMGGIAELRQFEPRPGFPDKSWPFYFPGEFRGRRFVKIDEFHLSRSSQSQYFHDFRLVLTEMGNDVMHPARKVPGTVISSPLPVGG